MHTGRCFGYDHVFVEKVPVVTKDYLDAASSYPQFGTLAVSATRREVKQTCCPAGLPVVPDPITGKIRRGLWDYLVGAQ